MSDLPAPAPRRRGLSMRMQLTLSYAALLLLVGLALLAVGLLIVRFIPEGNLTGLGGEFAPGRGDLIVVYVRYSLWALLALAIVGLGGGWLLAGRMLRPLTRITQAAQRARDGSLTHRIRMPGRQNELADLADTFDDMLERIERAVGEHRRFAANAAHELRTPHAVVRTMLEVARADPDGRDLEVLLGRVAEMNERSIVLTEALLVLAEIDHVDRPLGLLSLEDIVTDALAEVAETATQRRVDLRADLESAPVMADAVLLRQLVTNLLRNAITHNRPSGEVSVTTLRAPEGTMLEVENTGDVLGQELVDTLTEPFVRGAGRTRTTADGPTGAGLGLAIVSSIARAHGASVTLTALSTGGLRVRVLFPEAAGPDVSRTYRNSRTEP